MFGFCPQTSYKLFEVTFNFNNIHVQIYTFCTFIIKIYPFIEEFCIFIEELYLTILSRI